MKEFFGGVICGICFVIGAVLAGTYHYHTDNPIIIKEVSANDTPNGKYRYSTNEFNFLSDSLYKVGDVLKLSIR